MKATHSEDLEFLKSIRGCFGSRRMWSVEYEFTGEEVIERRGGHIKNQIRISDIVETQVLLGFNQMILKTNSSQMRVQIIPSLNEVIMKHAAEFNAKLSESERQHFEEVSRQTISRFKRDNLIGGIFVTLVMVALAFCLVWLKQKHYLP